MALALGFKAPFERLRMGFREQEVILKLQTGIVTITLSEFSLFFLDVMAATQMPFRIWFISSRIGVQGKGFMIQLQVLGQIFIGTTPYRKPKISRHSTGPKAENSKP